MTTPLATVPQLDLQRYLGTWYEIARKPMRHEDATAQDITATYSMNEDGSVKVLNACINAEGEVEEVEGAATPVDATNAKLEVTFLPKGLRWIPFTKGDYWVMRVDPQYNLALVGDPERKYLWLLARQPTLEAGVRDEWLAFARAQGYDVDDIILPRQSGTVHREQD